MHQDVQAVTGTESTESPFSAPLAPEGPAKRNSSAAGRPDVGRSAAATLESLRDFLCFTPGSRIATPQGARAVEDLAPGDLVLTRDNGMQPVGWRATVRLGTAARPLPAALTPMRIRKGALGNGLPERDLIVSPGHRMLVCSPRIAEGEVLIASRDLVGRPGVERLMRRSVTYVHFMCPHHEIVLADGAWSESFQPGEPALAALDAPQRAELMQIFPGLRSPEARNPHAAIARRAVKGEEARRLLAG